MKGRYVPRNPEKYRGRADRIVFRSSWERAYMIYCDLSPTILQWSSEEFKIPYYDYRTKKWRRYYVDFWVKYQDPDGEVHEKLVEIKPYKQTRPPRRPGEGATRKKHQRWHDEMKTYQKNQLKWEAAKKFADKMGMEFVKMTERDLGIG